MRSTVTPRSLSVAVACVAGLYSQVSFLYVLNARLIRDRFLVVEVGHLHAARSARSIEAKSATLACDFVCSSLLLIRLCSR